MRTDSDIEITHSIKIRETGLAFWKKIILWISAVVPAPLAVLLYLLFVPPWGIFELIKNSIDSKKKNQESMWSDASIHEPALSDLRAQD